MQDKYLHPIAAKAGTRLRQQWQTNREKKADQELNGCGFCSCVPVFGLSVYFFLRRSVWYLVCFNERLSNFYLPR